MDDHQLANELLMRGIGINCGPVCFEVPRSNEWTTDSMFVRDWRTAGECLKRWRTTINTEQLDMTLDEMLRDPRSICEAFATTDHRDQERP